MEITDKSILKQTTGKLLDNENETTGNLYNTNTERLLFQEITCDDLKNIHKLHTVPAVDEFNTLGIPGTIEDTRIIVKSMVDAKSQTPRNSYTWKIILKKNREFIGLAGLILSNDKFRLGEIFYKLHPDFWGNGYATEIAKRLVKAGFEDFNLHKVEAGVATGNVKSIRVLEKAGMTREGSRRKILPIRGEWKDSYLYAIVESDISYAAEKS